MTRIYFDNAATTALSPTVLEAMLPLFTTHYGNPSSIHADGRQSRAAVEQARKSIAQTIRASIGEVFFTSGGTEGNNTAIKGAVTDLGVRRILSSRLEHHCVLHSIAHLATDKSVEVVYLTPHPDGSLDLTELETLLRNGGSTKTLVSLMHGNNEIGTLMPLGEVSALCQLYGALLHTDTVQTIGHFEIDVQATPIDFLTASAHKFHGPKGTGFLYINSRNHIKPYIDGGSQERNMRGGTENVAGIVGMAAALREATDAMHERRTVITALRNHMRDSLRAAFGDAVGFNGAQGDAHSLYHVLSVLFPETPKAEMLLFNLDISGISASGGSACSSGSDTGSHVLAALDPTSTRTTIRFSFSHHNTTNEVDAVVGRLVELLG